ncbi:acyltransferase [Mucilaginibacter sp. Bleaf8]|uniref:acyltransferase family protein n=1 Tax=Mucilaginibacter sp. Bleaf8 TaxID=2834430 RepID=UPI001BD0D9AD|nr:acyltransferase [Mucilaginibacter sp. Bleaf8]MBS7566814.1 acyltransferase [Mucilaginibacter sp. Bleaf8]
MAKSHQTIESLQVLRAFAAISVMGLHGTHIMHMRLGFHFWDEIFNGGCSGVDVFFVISGFIILHTSTGKGFKPLAFLKRRFLRIYPLYWIVTLLLVIAYQVTPVNNQPYKESASAILGSLSLLPQNFYVIGTAWTLTYEVMFYTVFALACAVSKRCLLATLSVWGTIILALYFSGVHTSSVFVGTLINPIILEFFFGCALAWIYHQVKEFKYAILLTTVGFVLFCMDWVWYWYAKNHDATAFSSYISRVYLFGIPAALLVGGAVYYKRPVSSLLVAVGNSSYSLYLIHGTVISTIIKFLFLFKAQSYFANNIGAVIILLLTIGISYVFYYFIERPIVNLFKPWNKRNPMQQPQAVYRLSESEA